MNNDLKHALGDRPNSEFILDPQGRIVVLRDWSRPESLRKDLEKLVGPVANPTRPEDLDLKIEIDQPTYKKGIVKRPALPQQMRPLKVTPAESKDPFFVKLRVEVESSVQRNGAGKVYLGFHLDPIHHVHWNNLAAPLEYEILDLKKDVLSPAKGRFDKVDVESDIDPREFVLTANGLTDAEQKSFRVRVRYFACSDIEGWCKPFTQEYQVSLEADPDGGSARRGGGLGARPGRRNPPFPPGGRGRFSVERFMEHDKDGDGKVTADELPPQFRRILQRADRNGDRAIDRSEAKMIEQRMQRRSKR